MNRHNFTYAQSIHMYVGQ